MIRYPPAWREAGAPVWLAGLENHATLTIPDSVAVYLQRIPVKGHKRVLRAATGHMMLAIGTLRIRGVPDTGKYRLVTLFCYQRGLSAGFGKRPETLTNEGPGAEDESSAPLTMGDTERLV